MRSIPGLSDNLCLTLALIVSRSSLVTDAQLKHQIPFIKFMLSQTPMPQLMKNRASFRRRVKNLCPGLTFHFLFKQFWHVFAQYCWCWVCFWWTWLFSILYIYNRDGNWTRQHPGMKPEVQSRSCADWSSVYMQIEFRRCRCPSLRQISVGAMQPFPANSKLCFTDDGSACECVCVSVTQAV